MEKPYLSAQDSAVSLVRLLAIAVEKLGGELEFPENTFRSGLPEYRLSLTDGDFLTQTRKLKVRRINKEVGDVLNVNTLAKAKKIEVKIDDVVFNHRWEAEANGEVVDRITFDLDAEYYVSPILTMSTVGVALVDSSGQMVAHSVRPR